MYKILNKNTQEDLFTRILQIRNITDNITDFLNPTYSRYWQDPAKLNDIEITVKRIIYAMEHHEKIMIFGDYDVDGISASLVIYFFITKFLNYQKISIRLPNRIHDGYGIKDYHIELIHKLGVKLIITVDNGITAINEAQTAKRLGIDMIITDHHKPLAQIPEVLAIINPHLSPDFAFTGLAGVAVAFKVVIALASKMNLKSEIKQQIWNYLLPLVTIGTVGDCVPLLNENRLLVKMGLDIINRRQGILPALDNFLNYFNLSNINAYHLGFQIAPRINACGRIHSPDNALQCLLENNQQKQIILLDELNQFNNTRKQMQEDMFKLAESQLDLTQKILIISSADFHEGILGLVAGKLTEKYNKPSIVMKIDNEKKLVTGSVRGPNYFDIVNMLNIQAHNLERYGGHKQAGGLTFKLEHLTEIIESYTDFCNTYITNEDMVKLINVDTILTEQDLKSDQMNNIEKIGPFGESNPEPIFLIDDYDIIGTEKVGKNTTTHLKIWGKKGNIKFPILFWGKGNEIDKFQKNTKQTVIGKAKKDTYNNSFYIDGIEISELIHFY